MDYTKWTQGVMVFDDDRGNVVRVNAVPCPETTERVLLESTALNRLHRLYINHTERFVLPQHIKWAV